MTLLENQKHTVIEPARAPAFDFAAQFNGPTCLQGAPSMLRSLSVSDWDVLFRAVTTRLRSCMSNVGAQPAPVNGQTAQDDLHQTLAECVAHLEQLHLALTTERRNKKSL